MIAKGFLSTLAAAVGTTALLEGSFTRYFNWACRTFDSSDRIIEGGCVNLGNSLITGLDGIVTASTSPVVSVYADPGCSTGLLTSLTIGEEAQCIA